MLPSGTPEYNHHCQAEHEQLNPSMEWEKEEPRETSGYLSTCLGQRKESFPKSESHPCFWNPKKVKHKPHEATWRRTKITNMLLLKDQNNFMKRNRESKSRKEKKEKSSKSIPKPERNIRKGFLHWKLAVAERLINGHLGGNLFPSLLQFSTDALNDSIHCFRCKPHLPSEDQTPRTVRWRMFESEKLSTV